MWVAVHVIPPTPPYLSAKAPCPNVLKVGWRQANGATYRQGGMACYAEFGWAAATGGGTTWQTCRLRAASVSCDFAEGDGTGDSEEAIGDADTPAMCAQLVANTRPEANGATYAMDGTACYAEFGMAGSTGAPSAWRTCLLVQGGGSAEDECADDFGSIFQRIQAACCVQASDCAHGTPSSCSSACSDLVLDFWGRCEGAVAEAFDESLHDQLDAFASVCEQAVGGGGGPPPPPVAVDPGACSADLPTVQQRCCKGRDCNSIPDFRKCSARCAAIFVSFFTECGLASFGPDHIVKMATLSQLCIDLHPGGGGGGGAGGGGGH